MERQMQIVSDREIAHRSETQGVVVTRVQIIEAGDRRFEARYWTQFETGALHHVDSIEIVA
jgi:hypothetical protein